MEILIYYFIAINILTFIIFGLDKLKAIHGKMRISVKTLLSLCIFGGSIGGLMGMYIFRHKTLVRCFTLGIPIILVFQIIIIFILSI